MIHYHIIDGLKRRPRADWTISYISCDLTASDIWIQSAVNLEAEPDAEETSNPPSPSSEVDIIYYLNFLRLVFYKKF